MGEKKEKEHLLHKKRLQLCMYIIFTLIIYYKINGYLLRPEQKLF